MDALKGLDGPVRIELLMATIVPSVTLFEQE